MKISDGKLIIAKNKKNVCYKKITDMFHSLVTVENPRAVKEKMPFII